MRARGRVRARYALPTVALLSALLMVAAASAAPPDYLASLTISLWPEYDRPGVLCIYRGEVAAGTPLPAQVTFRLPRIPTSTAAIDEQGQFRYLRPTLQEEGDGYLVTCELEWPRFQLEYYDETLRQQGVGRELEFTYRADYAVEQMVLEVKEPYGAAGLTLEPPADTRSQAGDGLTEHRRTVGTVVPGQEVCWRLTYSKADARLAAEALGLPTPAAMPYEPAPSGSAPRSGRGWLPWAAAGLAAVAMVAVTLGGLRGGVSGPTKGAAPTGRGRRRSGRARARAVPATLARYCFRCGTAMNKEDLFCRRCGARRRGA